MSPQPEADGVGGTGRPSVKSVSFRDQLPESSDPPLQIRRPESHSKLLNLLAVPSGNAKKSPDCGTLKLTKLLLNVTVQGSLGAVHVVLPPEKTVSDMIKASVDAYVREGRRPLLTEKDPRAFELHYSEFSLDCLNPNEELGNLGSRNFFLCPKQQSGAETCSNPAKKATKASFP